MMSEEDSYDVISHLDCLPYYDRALEDSSIRKEVNKMIEEEMKKMNKDVNSYVSHYPELDDISYSKDDHPFLYELQERVESDFKIKMYCDEKYEIDLSGSSHSGNFSEENLKELEELKVGLGYLRHKHIHLLLLKENAKSAWNQHNSQTKEKLHSIRKISENMKNNIEKVNRKRKRDQLKCGKELDRMKLDEKRLDNDLTTVEIECNRVKKKRKFFRENFEIY